MPYNITEAIGASAQVLRNRDTINGVCAQVAFSALGGRGPELENIAWSDDPAGIKAADRLLTRGSMQRLGDSLTMSQLLPVIQGSLKATPEGVQQWQRGMLYQRARPDLPVITNPVQLDLVLRSAPRRSGIHTGHLIEQVILGADVDDHDRAHDLAVLNRDGFSDGVMSRYAQSRRFPVINTFSGGPLQAMTAQELWPMAAGGFYYDKDAMPAALRLSTMVSIHVPDFAMDDGDGERVEHVIKTIDTDTQYHPYSMGFGVRRSGLGGVSMGRPYRMVMQHTNPHTHAESDKVVVHLTQNAWDYFRQGGAGEEDLEWAWGASTLPTINNGSDYWRYLHHSGRNPRYLGAWHTLHIIQPADHKAGIAHTFVLNPRLFNNRQTRAELRGLGNIVKAQIGESGMTQMLESNADESHAEFSTQWRGIPAGLDDPNRQGAWGLITGVVRRVFME